MPKCLSGTLCTYLNSPAVSTIDAGGGAISGHVSFPIQTDAPTLRVPPRAVSFALKIPVNLALASGLGGIGNGHFTKLHERSNTPNHAALEKMPPIANAGHSARFPANAKQAAAAVERRLADGGFTDGGFGSGHGSLAAERLSGRGHLPSSCSARALIFRFAAAGAVLSAGHGHGKPRATCLSLC